MTTFEPHWPEPIDVGDCEDPWHVVNDGDLEDVCPTCGYRVGGEDDGAPWPTDVFVGGAP